MSGGGQNTNPTKPLGNLGSIAADGTKTNAAGDVTGYQAPKQQSRFGSEDGFHLSGFGNGWTAFKDNKTGKGLSSADVVRPLIDSQPMVNQQTIPGSSVTSSQTAPLGFMGMDGSNLAAALTRSPELAAGYSTLFGSGVDGRGADGQRRVGDGGSHAAPTPGQQHSANYVAQAAAQPAATATQTGQGSQPTVYSGFRDMSGRELRGAIGDLQSQNGWLDQNAGNGTYGSGLATRMPQQKDFANNRDYLVAQAQWQQKRENRYGDANQESWGLKPGTPEWAAYRAKMGLPG